MLLRFQLSSRIMTRLNRRVQLSKNASASSSPGFLKSYIQLSRLQISPWLATTRCLTPRVISSCSLMTTNSPRLAGC